jgi:aquaporin TIP
MEFDPTRKVIGEFIGTFMFVFAVSMSVALTQVGFFGIAIAQGLALGVIVSSFAHISGAHFNPAVTLGALLTRRIGPVLAVLYWLAQFGAAALGALVAKVLLPDQIHNSLGAPTLAPQIDRWQGLLLEALLTFFLVWVVFATAMDSRGVFPAIAGLGIGLIVTVDILMAGPLTGAAMNPARTFGPELVQNHWTSSFWIWYAGPLLGGAIAALLYDGLFLSRRVGDGTPTTPEPA